MTAENLFYWRNRFDARMCREVSNILLLNDNFSSNVINDTLPELLRIFVLFFPPKTTSKNQPCYAGIITALKVRYRRFQMERAIDISE